MATKTSWHRYGSKLRHCHLMYISQNLVNCCTPAGKSCTTNPHQFEAMGLQHYGRPTCNKLWAYSLDMSTVVGVVITHQRAWPSTSRIDLPWRNFLSPEFGTKFHKEVFYFRGTRISISIGQWKKAPMPKPALPFIRFDTTRPHSVKQVKRQLENRARSLIINTLRKSTGLIYMPQTYVMLVALLWERD